MLHYNIFHQKPSTVSTDLSKCGLMYVSHKETNGKGMSGDVGCSSSSNVARSNQKINVDTSPTVSTNTILSNVGGVCHFTRQCIVIKSETWGNRS